MNKVVLIGRLTRDSDLRFAAGSGTAVCRFTIAVNRRKKEDGADFIQCVAFNKTAETISQYLTKGREIAIAGRINTGSYDKDGKKVYTTDIAVENFEFIGSGTKKENADDGFNHGYDDIEPVVDGEMPF